MEDKIALCFLTYNNLSQSKLWKKFINSKYNIYIHNKSEFKGEFEEYCIKNRVKTKWGHISLVKATLNLFKEAFQTKENKYFVLLSDKCIPLYSADEIYNNIKNIDSNLLQNFSGNQHSERYYSLADKNFFNKDTFIKQHQWMLLKRDTVKFFIENDYTDSFSSVPIPDEHYFINVINKFNIPYKNQLITFSNWNEKTEVGNYRPYPKTYSVLTNNIIENIINKNFIFMRKVSPNCELPDYFDALFDNSEK
jgi:hypothetical protein